MAWQDDLEPDWFHELPFWVVAAMAHGALLTFNPALRWGDAQRAPERVLPIEFVAAPPPAPAPAPELPPPGIGQTPPTPKNGPGPVEREQVKQGALDAPKPVAKPTPKPAAVKAAKKKPGNTIKAAKAKPVTKAKPKTVAAPKPVVDREAVAFAKAAQAESARLRAVRVKEERALAEGAARERREREAELARALAARKAEAARIEAERREAERQERLRAAAEARAVKARRKAELTQALAASTDADEALAEEAPPAATGGGRGGRGGAGTGAAGAGTGAGELAGARRATAAAALAESDEPGTDAGSGGADLIDSKARGGGEGPSSSGDGVSWSIDGGAGSRRLIQREVPTSPDWVGSRGLDLRVSVRFQILPDGRIKPGAVIQKTSGFAEIDRRAVQALRGWRFAPAPATKNEIWGRAVFRFTSS